MKSKTNLAERLVQGECGGVYVGIRSESDIERALPMIRLAREIARA